MLLYKPPTNSVQVQPPHCSTQERNRNHLYQKICYHYFSILPQKYSLASYPLNYRQFAIPIFIIIDLIIIFKLLQNNLSKIFFTPYLYLNFASNTKDHGESRNCGSSIKKPFKEVPNRSLNFS